MNFTDLTLTIQNIHVLLSTQAKRSINVCITIRNWLFGCYIQEYELNGSDRSRYGENLLEKIAERLQEGDIPATSHRSLRLYKQFYQQYPGIWKAVFTNLEEVTMSHNTHLLRIWQTLSAKSIAGNSDLPSIPPNTLLQSLSFSHFVELIKINDPLKRCFYEFECIKNNLAIRELKRQINSLYYERTALSKDKSKSVKLMKKNLHSQNINDVIKDPYVFEFLGLKFKEVIYESDLSNALIGKLQEFLLELGKGFCFEARNKRILIGNDYYFIDLVFYHRILKCHVLIELKLNEFNHENIGQLKTYLNFYKKHETIKGDNPPIGILLCTEKNHALVEYALGDENQHKLFVSKYKLKLPSKEEMKNFLEKELIIGLKDKI